MTTTAPQWSIERPGGRQVAVRDLTPGAPADAPLVLLCHAAPGSAEFDPDPTVTAAAGVRLVALDRPGYGGSDPVEGFATVGSAADDAAAVLERLGPAGAAGWSGGGRVALALAARRPDLVGRVAVVATPAPDEEVPWVPDEHRAGIEALRGLPADAAHAALAAVFGPAVVGADARLDLVGASAADESTLERPGVRDRLRRMLDEAFAQGTAGVVADLAGYTLQPWGFAPEQVRADVLLCYGADDPLVPPPHGEWWRGRLPSARLDVLPDVGHLVVVPAWASVLEHLAPR
jgi:pimeloyl-ACP methyl ester carboxylesterase